MGELIPSVLLHGQAITLLEELKEAQSSGAIKDVNDMVARLTEIITAFEEGAGMPFLRYESVAETEPPSSDKANRFWRDAERDIKTIQQQLDISRSAAIFTHNLITTEIENSKQQNARVKNKLKTLQMYTDSMDNGIITFGDTFRSFDFVDLRMIPQMERPALFGEGYVTLAQEGDMVNLSAEADIDIIDSSNGFLGNNQEIISPENAITDPETGETYYTFKAEERVYDELEDITDGEPDTWVEYERYELTDAQRRSAKSYNFTYKLLHEDGTSEYLDWSQPPGGGILRLGLQFDFGTVKNLNAVEFTPYGLEENHNYPVLVRQLQTSPNGTDWTLVFPSDLWVGTDVNLQHARTAPNVVTERALWAFEPRAVRYMRMFIEQHHPVHANVGHIYWVSRDSESNERIEGPTPLVENPTEYHSKYVVGNLLQRREFFEGKRWAIGIRDILAQKVEYVEKSTVITQPLRVGGLVDRVMLDQAEISIPPEYPVDQHWVKFYISPNNGEDWFQLSRIEDNFIGVPEQIAFNDPLPEEFREFGVEYINVDDPVTTLRLKIELTRPEDLRATTPILRSYVLKVRRR